MLDLGAKTESPKAQAPARTSRGQRVWAVLLVLDSFFVIIFGGALAAKLYQHWQAPPVVVMPPRPRPAPKPAAAPAAQAPPKLAPAPATISLPKAKTAAAEPARKRNGPTPKPSLLQDAPRHESAQPREADSSQAASSAPAPAASGGKAKAQPVEFHYKGRGHRVELAGAFIVHGNGRKAMVQRDGAWSLTVYLTPNTYRYWFVVDGKKVLDPDNPAQSRSASVVSVAAP